MTTNLPTLKIGCGMKWTTIDGYGIGIGVVCGETYFCEGCSVLKDKVLPVLLAHARSHQEKMQEALEKEKDMNYHRVCLDAVLALAGKTKIGELEAVTK